MNMKCLAQPLFLLFGIFFLMSSCFSDPEFSDSPRISLENVRFVPGSAAPSGTLFDSLNVTIKIQDGDGDLGLDVNSNLGNPFIDNAILFFDSISGQPIFSPELNAIRYGFIDVNTGEITKTTINDTIPEYEGINVCLSYDTTRTDPENDSRQLIIYKQTNPQHNNIDVNFFRRVSGEDVFIDWVRRDAPNCSENFNARFGLPDQEVEGNPKEVLLTYAILGLQLGSILANDTIRLDIKIRDRALNESNVVSGAGTVRDMQEGNFRIF